VAFGLAMNKWEKQAIDKRVKSLLAFIGLSNYGDRNVTTLSGGEQQRVALVRSLAPKPKLLMLDEPIGSLDRTLREDLLISLREILNEFEQSVLYVTHDQEEAFSLADRVVVMSPGEIAQIGTPATIYSKPSSIFVAKFLGFSNIIQGTRKNTSIRFPFGDMNVYGLPFNIIPDRKEYPFLIRPDSMRTERFERDLIHPENKLTGIISERLFRGNHFQVKITINMVDLRFDLPSDALLPEVGKEITLFYDPKDAIQVLGQY
jgi:thiamine transport system ATP-binding protein